MPRRAALLLASLLYVPPAFAVDTTAAWHQLATDALAPAAAVDALAATIAVARAWPGDCRAQHRVAVLADRCGQAAIALERARIAARLCPNEAAVLYDAGRIAARLGCDGESVGYLSTATLLAPADPRARMQLAAARASVAARFADLDRDLASLEQAVGIAGPGTEQVSRRTARLVSGLERIARADPTDAEALLRLATALGLTRALTADGGDVRREFELARRVVELRPAWPQAWLLLGTLELTSTPSYAAAAERALLEAITVAGDEPIPAAWSALVFVHLSAGRESDAQSAAATYLALVPDDPMIGRLVRVGGRRPRNLAGSQGVEPR